MPDRVTLPALTSLRFFLAALVVLRHSNGLFGIPPSFAYLAFGQSVSGFFVLSVTPKMMSLTLLNSPPLAWQLLLQCTTFACNSCADSR